MKNTNTITANMKAFIWKRWENVCPMIQTAKVIRKASARVFPYLLYNAGK